jgi:hypothetical protein
MNRKNAMDSLTVHFFTKEILKLSEKLDVVDRYYDAKLACDILKAEMDQALKN